MRKGKIKVFSALLSAAMVTGLLTTSPLTVEAAVENYTNPTANYSYNSSDPLYAATHFHFFAEDTAIINAHCHGNAAATTLVAKQNSGSNKLGADVSSEIFYFKEADGSEGAFSTDFAGATVVLGSDIDVIRENGETKIYVEGIGYKKIEPNSTIYTESVGQKYIDFTSEFTKLRTLSTNLAGEVASTQVSLAASGSNYTIDLINQTELTSFVNIDASTLSSGGDFYLKNIDTFKSGKSLIVNYKIPTGTSSYTVPFTKIIMSDSTGQLNSTEDWGAYAGHGNILWNFYTEDGVGNPIPYSGTIKTCDLFKGSILAPSADIVLANSNQDGNYIGKNVTGGGGQTHRWDFGGALPNYGATPADTNGSLEVYVSETGSGTPIKNVTATVKDSTGAVKATITTDAKGKTKVVGELPIGSEYTVTITAYPNGYDEPVVSEKTVTIPSTATIQVPFELDKSTGTSTVHTGSLRVYVMDTRNNEPVSDVSILVTAPNGTDTWTLTTDDSGYTSVITGLEITSTPNVAPFDYHVVETTDVPDKYITPTDKINEEITSTALQTVVIYLTPVTGSLQATITDERTGDPIKDATVQIKDEDGKVIATVTTDSLGRTPEIPNLPIKETYTIDVTNVPSGYAEPSDKDVYLETSEKVVVPFVVLKTEPPVGSLQVQIIDEDTKDPIKGATVEIKTADGVVIDTFVTDEDGWTPVQPNLTINNTYTVHVTDVPDGYSVPTDKTQKITSGTETHKVIVEVDKETGSLQATIKDETSGDPIKGATVEIKDEDGNVVTTVTTDENGKTPVVPNLTIGETYTIHVTEVPDGYEPPADKTQTITGTETVNVDLVVDKDPDAPATGSLQATIKDETTGDPIKNATVEIKDEDGNVITTVTTDENGKTPVVPNLTIGKTYIIHTVSVPDGYQPPADKSQTITSTDTVTVDLVVDKTPDNTPVTGSIQATITDKITGDPIANATVEIKDSTGKVIQTVVTDSQGTTPVVSGLTIGQTYTVHVVSVPSGYTAPDDKQQTITSAETIKVNLVVSKQTETAVDTGDHANVMPVAFTGLFALVAFTVLMMKRKEEEF